jgi:hypothetical protein
MPVAIALIILGWTLAYSALKGLGLTDLLGGVTGATLDPAGGRGGTATGGGSATVSPGSDAAHGGGTSLGGLSPKSIIDSVVIPMAQANGIDVSPESVAAANGRHGPTITGSRSDHQGPPAEAWAADMSNGSSPTPEMDKLAAQLARRFNLKWSGSGAVSGNINGFRVQLIYRSMVGGNHYNHVHFGIRKA